MFTIYSVLTFYGTKEKNFKKEYNARNYYKKLCKLYDSNLIEFYSLKVDQETFIYTDFDD